MTPRELARMIAPFLGIEARDRLAPLYKMQCTDIALRYEWVNDWNKFGDILIQNIDDIQLYDGQEWFTLDTVAMDG